MIEVIAWSNDNISRNSHSIILLKMNTDNFRFECEKDIQPA